MLLACANDHRITEPTELSDLPDGLSGNIRVQSLRKKFSAFAVGQIIFINSPVHPTEGRIAIVTDAGLDAMAASGAPDEGAWLADGEVVWS